MTVQDDINARGVERRNPRASAIGLMETSRLPRFHILTAVSLAVAFYSSLRHLYAIHRVPVVSILHCREASTKGEFPFLLVPESLSHLHHAHKKNDFGPQQKSFSA